MKKFINVRTRFAIYFGSITLVLTFMLSTVVSRNFINGYKEEVGELLSEKSIRMAEELDQYIWSRYGEINVLSELDLFKTASNKQEIRSAFDELKKKFLSYLWIGLVNPNGEVLESTDSILKDQDISQESIFNKALNHSYIGDEQDPVFLSVSFDDTVGKSMTFLDISTPIYSDNGSLVGVLASHLSWEWDKEMEKTMIQLNNYDSSIDVFVVSKQENVVLLGPEEFIGENINIEGINKARNSENGWIIETCQDEKKYLTGYNNHEGLGWVILTRQPLDLAYEQIYNFRDASIIFGVLSAVVFSVFGFVSANKITSPLERLANYDSLTNLPNRIALDSYLENTIEITKEENSTFTILYLDLDGFKGVNDTYGHHVGDLLLQEVAARLKCNIEEGEIVVRIGGDEFIVIVKNLPGDCRTRGTLVANTIIKQLSSTFIIEENKIKVGCSIGGAIWPIDSLDPIDVMRLADQALYKSKHNGKGQFTYHSNEV